jgi:excisionase family DNA binding protein
LAGRNDKTRTMGDMNRSDRNWLSTGQAAELCAVTPATVLNWIRSGRLEGVRTPGGHYRIREEKLRPMVATGRPSFLRSGSHPRNAPLRCWEYLSDRGEVRDECLDCVVYTVRAALCFQIATLGLDTGHSRRSCPTSCDDCAYYRRVKGLPTNVLIVSSDTELLESLRQEPGGDVVLHFAQNAYEASAAVENFLPAFAVVDLDSTAVREGGLLESLSRDPRLPGLKTVVAVPPRRSGRGGRIETSPFVAGRIEKPFDLSHIRAVIESFPVESPILGNGPLQEYPTKGDPQ